MPQTLTIGASQVGNGTAPADKTRMEYVVRRKSECRILVLHRPGSPLRESLPVHLMKSMILLHAWLARLDVSRRAPNALRVRTSLRARVHSSRARSSRLQLAAL